ncbi:uncharacterized protein LOC119262217 [Pygocentrus nattereri]|uniref:uncharacterized protein LOC119262217 n=1 Tax=Pygocentrus nattereri TaxID=42514 RepID=UPI001890EEE6|nr:uncharacterized protein LOC119262217 [Pygocentrus nattereri]
MNVYEDAPSGSRMEMSECVKTEDVYQTLHQPPPVKNPNPAHEPVRSCRIKTVLMIFNTLLLIVILILNGLSTANQLQSAEVNKPEPQSADVKEMKASGEDSEREELWRLHDDVFYLFWEAEGNCSEALKFCKDRNSEIATTSGWDRFDHWMFLDESFHHPANPDHELWILSQANGRKLWVNMDSDTTGPLNETFRHCPPDEETPGNAEGMQGWVCEIRPRHLSHRHYRHFLSRRRYLEDYEDYFGDIVPDYDTAAPEHEIPALSVLSVKIYIITLCSGFTVLLNLL